jgi:3-oxoacyl-[acyl-carrier protein] reductase
MNILITGTTSGLGKVMAEKCEAAGHTVIHFNRDICDLENVEIVKDITFDRPIDCFINNAARGYDHLITSFNSYDCWALFNINTISPMALTAQVIKNMLYHNTKGSIIHITSICAHTGFKGLSMYAATKGAIEAFSKNIAREWGSKGIRSNCIAAGFMKTKMSESLDNEKMERIARRNSLKELVSVEAVADMAIHLITAQGITGQTIHVDNGAM